jgi:hypothetical protein
MCLFFKEMRHLKFASLSIGLEMTVAAVMQLTHRRYADSSGPQEAVTDFPRTVNFLLLLQNRMAFFTETPDKKPHAAVTLEKHVLRRFAVLLLWRTNWAA